MDSRAVVVAVVENIILYTHTYREREREGEREK
jgi:hypothetical protein